MYVDAEVIKANMATRIERIAMSGSLSRMENKSKV